MTDKTRTAAEARADEVNRIVRAVLQTVIDESPDGIDFDTTVVALLSVVAELAVIGERFPTPRDERLYGEHCGKGLAGMMKTIRESIANGSHSNIIRNPTGPLN